MIFHPGSEILILPWLSYLGCHERAVHWLHWNSHTWQTSDIIVMLKSVTSCHVASQSIQEHLGVFFLLKHKTRYLTMSKKKNPLFV